MIIQKSYCGEESGFDLVVVILLDVCVTLKSDDYLIIVWPTPMSFI